ncbi:hypothetical protein ASwh1_336 [Aeromonas phage Aswh_1]|nr:hypothetical protein ASwh1_336 [Aeromonas phage Aswh_1]
MMNMKEIESMSDKKANAVATQIVYGLDNWVISDDNRYVVYELDGTEFPVYDYVSNPFEVMKEFKISVNLDDGESFAYSGVWYDDISGSISRYEHESHCENIGRAIINVFISMNQKS